jgi:hypothetical protein
MHIREFEYIIRNNKINKLDKFIKKHSFDIAYNDHWAISYSCVAGNIDIVKILLKQTKEIPDIRYNYPIRVAFEKSNDVLVNLLWQQKRVKMTLKQDNSNLYTILRTKDIKEKIDFF